MKVNLGTIEVDDDYRRAIRAHFGKTGKATRKEVKNFYQALADADMEGIVHDWRTLKDTPKEERPRVWT